MSEIMKEREWVMARNSSYHEMIRDSIDTARVDFGIEITEELAWDMVKMAILEGHLYDIQSAITAL